MNLQHKTTGKFLRQGPHLVACLLALLVLQWPAPVRAQSANDGFEAHVVGAVWTLASQRDGAILVGGDFSKVSGVARQNLARLKPDGSLDLSFEPNPDSEVECIAVQADGKIVIGGDFENFGGVVCEGIARLLPNGARDLAFTACADNEVDALVIQPDGLIVAGGRFHEMNGQPRLSLARLLPDGSLDMTFTPGADDGVQALLLQPDGRIVVGGLFTRLGGAAQAGVGRLNANGSLDTNFTTSVNGWVYALAQQADGKILVGGLFDVAGGLPRTNLVRLNRDGSVDTTFAAVADDWVWSLAVQADGRILVGGWFSTLNGAPQPRLGRLLQSGEVDASFRPAVTGDDVFFTESVDSLLVQADGKIVLGGVFDTVSGQSRTNLARLYGDGSVDATLNPGTSDVNHLTNDFPIFVHAGAVITSGKCIVGGNFLSLAGHPREKLALLGADGTVDTNFQASGGPFSIDGVISLLALPEGKCLVGGGLASLNGQLVGQLGRLNADGTLDSSFTNRVSSMFPSGSQGVDCMAVQADGMIVLGGIFIRVDGVQRRRLARLTAQGTLDPVFNPAPNGSEICIASQPDGKLVVGGNFSTIGGLSRSNLVRLNWDGTVDTNFNPVVGLDPIARGSGIFCIALQTDGKILIGGWFTSINGVPRYRLARLNPDGSLDGSFGVDMIDVVETIVVRADGSILVDGGYTPYAGGFQPAIRRITAGGILDESFAPAAFPYARGLVVQQDGKIIVIGSMTNVAGATRPLLGRLSVPEAASQRLSVDSKGKTVTWTRGGSGPEVWNASMAWSTDGTNYAQLGNAVRISGGWQLDGLNVPASQHFYIRANGRTVSGHKNSSSGLIESVAQFWRLPPPFLNNVQVLGDGQFQFSFTNTNAVAFTVLASTNLAAPLAQWESLGAPVPAGGGNYQFTDPGATNHARRFYQLRTP
jgi:uncharacterized delta-60 repeat protein